MVNGKLINVLLPTILQTVPDISNETESVEAEAATQQHHAILMESYGHFIIAQQIEIRETEKKMDQLRLINEGLQEKLESQSKTIIKLNGELKKSQAENRSLRYKRNRTEMKALQRSQNDAKFKRSLQSILTDKQLSAIASQRKVKKWTLNDIARSLTLRALSSKSYNFLRTEMRIPLPAISTLKNWTKHFKLEPGIFHHVILVLSKHLLSKSPISRIVSFSVDEVSVDADICYDQSRDQFMGPHSTMNVMMARGLCSPWKQPIYADFDKALDKSTLLKIIQKFAESGLLVKTLTHDLGSKNVALWKELNVSHSTPYFETSQNGSLEKVFVFPDFPHLLVKCIIGPWNRHRKDQLHQGPNSFGSDAHQNRKDSGSSEN